MKITYDDMEKQIEKLDSDIKQKVLKGNIVFEFSNAMYSYLAFYGLGSVSSIKMPNKIIDLIANERDQWAMVNKDNYRQYLIKSSSEQLGMYNRLNKLSKKTEFHGYKISSFGFQKEFACSVYNVNLLLMNITKSTWGIKNKRPISNLVYILSELMEIEVQFENNWAIIQYYLIKWISQQEGIVEFNDVYTK